MSESRQIFIGVVLLLVIMSLGVFVIFSYLTEDREVNEQNVSALFSSGSEAVFTDVGGNEITMETDTLGVRVVNVWASWSPFSVEELPLLHQTVATYGADRVTVIAVNRNESRERAEAFLSQLGDLSNLTIIIDQNDQVYANMEGYAMPETHFYDESGNLAHHHRGVLKESDIERYLSDILE